MISPQDYIGNIKDRLLNSPMIEKINIFEENSSFNSGYFRVRFSLKNGDFVEAAEYFTIRGEQIIQQRYRYQWMDSTQTLLRRRWDNAAHFREIPTFPHHVHVDREDNVMPSHMFGIAELVDILETILDVA